MCSNAHDVLALILDSNRNAFAINASVGSNTNDILTLVLLDTLAVLAHVTFDTQLVAHFFDALSAETHFIFGTWLFTQWLILVASTVDADFSLRT